MVEQTSHANRRRRWWLRALAVLKEERSEPSFPRPAGERSPPVPALTSTASLRRTWRIESGLPNGLSLRLFQPDTGQILRIPLVDPWFLVGQGPRCQLRLLEAGIADLEIALIWAEGSLWRIDLQPQRLTDRLPLLAWQPGDEEQWGSWQVSVIGLPQGAAVPLLSWWTPVESGPLKNRPHDDPPDDLIVELEWHARHQRRSTLLPTGLSLVGAGQACDVHLPDSRAVAVQAAFVRTKSSLWLLPLAGSAAPRVNGQEVQYAALDPGDKVEFGEFSATVRTHWPQFPGRQQTAVRTEMATPALAGHAPASEESALREHWAHFQQVEQQLCQFLENVSDIDAACIEQFKSAGRHCQQALEVLLEADRPKEKSPRRISAIDS